MSIFRVYLKPFTDAGEYQADWIDITEDVDLDGISAMKKSLDNSEYDIGILKNANVTIKLVNLSGRFSDVGQPGSVFKFRRSNSLVRITWAVAQEPICGFAVCGAAVLSEEVTAFEGILDDTGLKQAADDQSLSFKVLGKEWILSETLAPFDQISNGDTFEEILHTCLNQTAITNLLTVDPANISCQVNVAVDDVATLENETVREAIEKILLYSNSVLYIIDDTIHIKPREASADTMFTFYGQGAQAGIENILDLDGYRAGLNRVFNFITWQDTTLVSEDLSSVNSHGYKKKQIETPLITDAGKQQQILDAIKEEFKNPKREMILRAPITYDTIALNVLDKVAIDYPNVAMPAGSSGVPLWDLAQWDAAKFPHEVLPIAIESEARFKILSRDIDPKSHEMIFTVREV